MRCGRVSATNKQKKQKETHAEKTLQCSAAFAPLLQPTPLSTQPLHPRAYTDCRCCSLLDYRRFFRASPSRLHSTGRLPLSPPLLPPLSPWLRERTQRSHPTHSDETAMRLVHTATIPDGWTRSEPCSTIILCHCPIASSRLRCGLLAGRCRRSSSLHLPLPMPGLHSARHAEA